MSPAELEYRVKMTVLIVFTLFINIRIIVLYFDGLELNKDAYELLKKDALKDPLKPKDEASLGVRKEVFGTPDGLIESKFIHYELIIILIGGLIILFQMSILVIVIIISAFFVCFMLYWEVRGRQLQAQRISQRNTDLIRVLKKFAFENIIFREATECAICLEPFASNDQVI